MEKTHSKRLRIQQALKQKTICLDFYPPSKFEKVKKKTTPKQKLEK